MAKKFNVFDHPPGGQMFAEATGELRVPNEGEYYLSGAIPEAYRAPRGMQDIRHIARLVPAPARRITIDGFTYRFEGIA